MSVEREPWAGPDSEAHRLVYRAEAGLLSAARQLRRAVQFGSWTGPWTDTVEMLRSVATDLRRLQEIGGADPAEADGWEPCHWCGRPTGERALGRLGHPRCAARADDTPAAETGQGDEALTRFTRAVQRRFPDATGREAAELFVAAFAGPEAAAARADSAAPALEGTEAHGSDAPEEAAEAGGGTSDAGASETAAEPAPAVPQDDARPGEPAPAEGAAELAPAPAEVEESEEPGQDERDLDELTIATRAIRHPDGFPDATDADITVALGLFHQHLTIGGTPVHLVRSPAHSGRVLYDRLVAANGKMKAPEALRSEKVWEITGPGHAPGEGLVRPRGFVNADLVPRLGQWITQTDVNAQYLAVVETTLGDGEPRVLTLEEIKGLSDAARADVLKSPGYAHVASKPDLSGAPVWVRGSLAQVRAGSWVMLPVVAYLRQAHGIQLRVDEIIYWGSGCRGPRLRAWGRPVRTAREQLLGMGVESLPVLYAAHLIKAVYSGFLGGETRSKKHNRTPDGKDVGGTVRPDWNDTFVAVARMNVFRALDKFAAPKGIAPLGGVTDSLWWLSDGPEPFTPPGWEMPDNRQPGKWKLDRHVQVTEEIVAAHATGSQTQLNKAIKAEWDRMKALQGDDR